MHDPHDMAAPAIPPFLAKLGKLVDDPATDRLICWDNSGKSFIILDTIRFTKELLPKYFKHNNLASFIRQLNMYGFRKIVSLNSGTLDNIKNPMEFAHTFFMRGHPYLMENIQRKLPKRNAPPAATIVKGDIQTDNDTAEMMTQILAEVNEVKNKQFSWDQKMAAMKRENESLWRELAIFRQKHLQQQQIINKLIQFIVNLARPASRGNHVPGVPLRRRYQLMLDGSKQPGGPTIREIDPVEQFLTETGTSYKISKTPNKFNPIALNKEQLDKEEQVEYIEAQSDTSPYIVFSPEETQPDSSWLNLEESDVEDAAMTPISPYEVTPVHISNRTPSTVESPPAGSVIIGAKPSALPRTLPVITVKRPVRITAKPCPTQNVTNKPAIIRETDISVGQKTSDQTNFNKANGAKGKPKTRKQMLPKRAMKKKEGKKNTSTSTESAIDDTLLKEAIDMINGDEKRTSSKLADGQRNATDKDVAASGEIDQEEGNLTVCRPSTSSYGSDIARDLSTHVDQVQGDIDILKELLKGDNYNLDANTLLELFNEDPLNLIMSSSDNRGEKQESEGQELMTYNAPNLVDLADMYVGTPAMEGMRGLSTSPPPPPSPTPSGLQTPIFVPSSPCFPSAAKRKRK